MRGFHRLLRTHPQSAVQSASGVGELLQGRPKTQAAAADQDGAEDLCRIVGKGARKPAAHLLATEQRANERVGKAGMLSAICLRSLVFGS